MDRWTTLAVGALLPVVGFAQVAEQTAQTFEAHVLTRAELDALQARPDELLVIDVRRPDEIGSIGGFAVYLNIQPADVEAHIDLIPRDRTIVTVSNHANRAGRVADVLVRHGFKVAGALGAQNYEAAGGALTHIASQGTAASLDVVDLDPPTWVPPQAVN
jgi:rhodanese-related sulfurtransferase